MQLFDEIDQVTTDYRRVVLGIEDDDDVDFGECQECGRENAEWSDAHIAYICQYCAHKLNAEYKEDCRLDSPAHEPRR